MGSKNAMFQLAQNFCTAQAIQFPKLNSEQEFCSLVLCPLSINCLLFAYDYLLLLKTDERRLQSIHVYG